MPGLKQFSLDEKILPNAAKAEDMLHSAGHCNVVNTLLNYFGCVTLNFLFRSLQADGNLILLQTTFICTV